MMILILAEFSDNIAHEHNAYGIDLLKTVCNIDW
jgi:hypothetical protein